MADVERDQDPFGDADQRAAFLREMDEELERLRAEYAAQPVQPPAVPTEADIAAFRVILAEHDAVACERAAAMLEKLGTEVTRLRLGISHYYYCDHTGMSVVELRRMTENWNGDLRAETES